MNKVLTMVGMLAVSLLAGCASKQQRMEQQNQQLQMFLAQPRCQTNCDDYRCQPPDVLTIKSAHILEINDVKQTVRPDGRINLPLVGEIPAAGRTPKEIELDILQAAGKYYSNADAMVVVTEYASQKFYVFGEVQHPGAVPYTGRDHLLDALAKAQPTVLCSPEKVQILRGAGLQCGGYLRPCTEADVLNWREECKKKGLNDCGAQELTVDVCQMTQSGDLSHNVLLKANDVIFVPAHPAVEFGHGVERWLYPARPILGAPATIVTAGVGGGN